MAAVLLGLLAAAALLLWRIGPVLLARYDGAALRVAPPAGVAPAHPVSRAGWPALRAWCFAAAGDGARPLWRPRAPPRVAQRFTLAVLADAPPADLLAQAEAFSRHIDGSDQLAALHGAVARIGLRLRVKAHDAMWWRARQPADPWDSGYLVDEPAALLALRTFVPRRATLLVASGLPADALQARISLLRERSAAFQHPVRLLVIGTPVSPAWGELCVIGR